MESLKTSAGDDRDNAGGSHKRLWPVVIYLLLSISTGLGALIYALVNALQKLTLWQLL